MSLIYEGIGRLVVALVKARFAKQLRIAGAAVAVGLALAAYLAANRDAPEA